MRHPAPPLAARADAPPMPPRPARAAPPWLASAVVGVVAFAAYLWLAPAVSGDRDSSEFTLVLALDGIAHPTGYPVYLLAAMLR